MRVLFVLLALVALWAVLGALHLVPLPFGLLERDDVAGSDGGLLESGGTDANTGARLEGTGERPKPAAEPATPLEPPVPAEVRGSVPRGAVIRGRVVAGTETPTPVAGAKVRLSRPNAITTFLKTPSEGRWDVLEARTGADGRFAFLEVRANVGYVVRARAGDRATTSSTYVDVVERQVLDLGDLPMGKDASLAGRVVNLAGEPLAGVRVAVAWNVQSIFDMVLTDPDLLPETEAGATTDAEGRFRLAPLESGPKTLVALGGDHGGTVRSGVVVQGDTTLAADIRLGAQGVVAGIVQWENGRPAAGASVFALDDDSFDGALFSTTSGPDGAFRFEHLEGDAVRLGVYLTGVMGQPTDKVKMGTLDKVMKLPDVGAVKGRVVRKADGRPVERFNVRLEPLDKEPWMAKLLRVSMDKVVGTLGFTSPDGTFAIPIAARGSYVAVVSAAGYPEGKGEKFEVPVAGTGDAGTIALAEGNVLSGSVRTTNGEPLVGAKLRVVEDKGLPAPDFDGEEAEIQVIDESAPDAYTDAEGRFTLPPQTPGKYQLFVFHPFAEDHREPGIDLKSGSRSDLDVRVKPAGAVRVQLLDPAGKPLSGEWIALVRPDAQPLWGHIGTEGHARFESVPPGSCVLRWSEARPTKLLADVARARGDEAARRAAYDTLRSEVGEHVVRAGVETNAMLRTPRRVLVRIRVEPWSDEVQRIDRLNFVGGLVGDDTTWSSTDRQVEGRFEILLQPGTYQVRAIPEPGGWNAGRLFEGQVVPDVPEHTLDLRR